MKWNGYDFMDGIPAWVLNVITLGLLGFTMYLVHVQLLARGI